MAFEIGQPVNIANEIDFETGKIHKIQKHADGSPAYIVEINRVKQVDHHWGINRVLISTSKLSEVA